MFSKVVLKDKLFVMHKASFIPYHINNKQNYYENNHLQVTLLGSFTSFQLKQQSHCFALGGLQH